MLLAQETTTSSGAGVGTLIYFVVLWVIIGLPTYFIFKKAGPNGDPAWGAFVPIYGFYILLKVVGRPGWWLIWIFIPIANIIVYIIVLNELSKSFGHGVGFTLGLIFLSWIFLAILAWGSSTYRGRLRRTRAAWLRRHRHRRRSRRNNRCRRPHRLGLPADGGDGTSARAATARHHDRSPPGSHRDAHRRLRPRCCRPRRGRRGGPAG